MKNKKLVIGTQTYVIETHFKLRNHSLRYEKI